MPIIIGILATVAILGLLIWFVVRPRLGRGSSILPVADQIASLKADVGTITRIDCPLKLTGDEVEGETYHCGVYTAPLDYGNPGGETLNLAFMVLRARNASPLPDPIVYLAGGPGQSGIVAASDSIYGDLRQDRDLIFPAQRGTLFSHRLGLEECVALLGKQMGGSELNAFAESFSGLGQLDRSLPYEEYLAQYRERAGAINARCHEAFRAAGLDPAQFTTANSADDLVGLMKALGYASYNLHGVSYGTRLALETMRRHPDAGIRSVVLDSPVAPSADRLAVAASAVHDSVIRLFEVCAADAACNAAYPNLVARANALVDRLAAAPITVGEKNIGRDEFIAQLTDLSGTRANYIPRLIAELERGETTTYLALANGEVGVQAVEGSALTSSVQELIAQVSTAAAAASNGDIITSIRIVADVVKAARQPEPRSAMQAVAGEKLAGAPELPAILARIDALTPQEIEELVNATAGAPQKVDAKAVALVADAQAKNNALFMLSGIVCHEQLDVASVSGAPDAGGDLAIPALRASGALLATEVGNCTNYPMGEADPSYHDPVSSDIPTLILQGEFDVRTPPINGRILAEQLANATLVMVPQAGHETWTGAGCVAEIGRRFFMHPDQPPDLSCLEARRERFSMPGELLRAPASR
jgi:pimeloyl-ACP methyl ester carboxylesterase